jgi:hypothetical protein
MLAAALSVCAATAFAAEGVGVGAPWWGGLLARLQATMPDGFTIEVCATARRTGLG